MSNMTNRPKPAWQPGSHVFKTLTKASQPSHPFLFPFPTQTHTHTHTTVNACMYTLHVTLIFKLQQSEICDSVSNDTNNG